MDEQVHSLMEVFILEAQTAFDCQIDVYPNTEMRMTASDHGYAEWVVYSISSSKGNNEAYLIVQDAGKSQRRFILVVLDDDPFILVHTYLMDDKQTYEINGKIHK